MGGTCRTDRQTDSEKGPQPEANHSTQLFVFGFAFTARPERVLNQKQLLLFSLCAWPKTMDTRLLGKQ